MLRYKILCAISGVLVFANGLFMELCALSDGSILLNRLLFYCQNPDVGYVIFSWKEWCLFPPLIILYVMLSIVCTILCGYAFVKMHSGNYIMIMGAIETLALALFVIYRIAFSTFNPLRIMMFFGPVSLITIGYLWKRIQAKPDGFVPVEYFPFLFWKYK